MKKLYREVVIITDVSDELGKYIAELFAKEDARLFFSSKNKNFGEKVAKDIRDKGGDATFINADISKDESVRKFVEKVVYEWGTVNVLVNNSLYLGNYSSFCEIETCNLNNIIKNNLQNIKNIISHIIPLMKKYSGGSIINISPNLGEEKLIESKSLRKFRESINDLTTSIALEYSCNKIRINTIHPGNIISSKIEDLSEEQIDYLVKLSDKHPTKRLGRFWDIADLALFLASKDSSYISGVVIPVNGGYKESVQ